MRIRKNKNISFPRPVWYWSDWSSCLAAGSGGRPLAAENHEALWWRAYQWGSWWLLTDNSFWVHDVSFQVIRTKIFQTTLLMYLLPSQFIHTKKEGLNAIYCRIFSQCFLKEFMFILDNLQHSILGLIL